MDKNKVAINLKHLPPIDPNSSFKGKPNNSKMAKPKSNQRMKLVDSVESIVQNPTLKDIVVAVEDKSKKTETLGNTPTPDEEDMKKGCGRSKLYEICAAKHLKPPVFECCKEEGPSHLRMFTFKVTMDIEKGEASKNIIEVYGAPHQKKKMAADDAAEGALWYLKHIGFVTKKK
ncbi:ribonuclease 3-like protein 1 isoform X2 [Cicer arietinum]|uniref:Ribonuclease 3-like protein 1 n=1 Tax=Cicer arietinum TaxID=3827 RepID=A0A1S2XDK8_CICAR|nr:ribonuclease 3-like protein 1 [Cicer arietinum]